MLAARAIAYVNDDELFQKEKIYMPRDSHRKAAEFHNRELMLTLPQLNMANKATNLGMSSPDTRLSTPSTLSQKRRKVIRNPQPASAIQTVQGTAIKESNGAVSSHPVDWMRSYRCAAI
jgi:predicted NACHT family NTPase